MTYRKRFGSDTWHWCRNCSNWPTSGYITWTGIGRPTVGELDIECLAKEKNGNCRR